MAEIAFVAYPVALPRSRARAIRTALGDDWVGATSFKAAETPADLSSYGRVVVLFVEHNDADTAAARAAWKKLKQDSANRMAYWRTDPSRGWYSMTR